LGWGQSSLAQFSRYQKVEQTGTIVWFSRPLLSLAPGKSGGRNGFVNIEFLAGLAPKNNWPEIGCWGGVPGSCRRTAEFGSGRPPRESRPLPCANRITGSARVFDPSVRPTALHCPSPSR